MTTTHTPTATRAVAGPASIAAALTIPALLWATYVNTPWKTKPDEWGIDTEPGLAGLVWIAAFVALGVGVVFGVLVRRALAAEPTRAARMGLILAVVGVPLTVLAFWTGLPIVLGIAAVQLGMDARARLGRTPATAGTAIVLGLLVAAFAFYFCITG